MEYVYFTDKAISGGYIVKRRVISTELRQLNCGKYLFVSVSGLKHPEKFMRDEDGTHFFHDSFLSEQKAIDYAVFLRRSRIEYHKRALGRLLAMKDDSIIDLSED